MSVYVYMYDCIYTGAHGNRGGSYEFDIGPISHIKC